MGGACGSYGREDKYSILVENLKERKSMENLHVDGRIILKRILKKWNNRLYIGLNCHSSEPSGSKKSG